MIKSVLIMAVATISAGAQAAAPASFAQCGVCHAVTKGAPNGIGPNLNGVVGKTAGAVTGFNYSTALKTSKLVWNAATLDKWITNPMKLVPGSRMPYAGQADAKKRAEIVAYMKTLK